MRFIPVHGATPTKDPRIFYDAFIGRFVACAVPDSHQGGQPADALLWCDSTLPKAIRAADVLEETGAWPDGKRPFLGVEELADRIRSSGDRQRRNFAIVCGTTAAICAIILIAAAIIQV